MGIRKRNRKVFGVGINDADYNTKDCPYYKRWLGILKRCYTPQKVPTYVGCTVCEDWLRFSNFKSWMEKQDWQGKEIDKDIIKSGNKVYCPDYCAFIDSKTNKFLAKSIKSESTTLTGTYWCPRNEAYSVRCSNPFTGKREYLGLYDCEIHAHLIWKQRKHEIAGMLAEIESDQRIKDSLLWLFHEDNLN